MPAVLSFVSSEYALVPIDLSFYAPFVSYMFYSLLDPVYVYDAYSLYLSVSFPIASMLQFDALLNHHTTGYFP
jgi:hypothetical protein